MSAHEAQITELANSSIECHFNSEITKLIADYQAGMIKAIALTNHETGTVTEIPVDEVVISHGYVRDKELLDNSPLAIERKMIILSLVRLIVNHRSQAFMPRVIF